jgi:hypothetical protein
VKVNENYENNSVPIFVHNVDDIGAASRKPLSCIHDLFTKICKKGLFQHIKFAKRNRAGNEGKSPVMHFGFSTTNWGTYLSNRSTMFGNVKPSCISSDNKNLLPKIRELLVRIIDNGTRTCPEGHNLFLPCPNHFELRQQYQQIFNKTMNVIYDDNGMVIEPEEFISCEAFTIIIPLILSVHKDFLNDRTRGMFEHLKWVSSLLCMQFTHNFVTSLARDEQGYPN